MATVSEKVSGGLVLWGLPEDFSDG